MTQDRHTGIDLPFVGRQAELETLRACVGRGRLALLTGEAGIGKTRIAEELALAAEVGGAIVHWGRCWEGDGAPAFWPWVQILRSHLRDGDDRAGVVRPGRVSAHLAALVPEIGAPTPATPPSPDPSHARFQLFDAITDFLREIAERRPLVVILEDLHWADPPSLMLLQYLAREIANAPILVVATYRTAGDETLAGSVAELARHRHCVQLAIGGLDDDEVRTCVERVLGTAPPTLVGALVRRTAGNPLFLGELVRLLARAPGDLLADPSALPIPDGVRDAVGRRLRGLAAPCGEILRVAAVVGDELSLVTLRAVAVVPPDDLLATLGEALAAGVLREEPAKPGRYRFAHALIRETLYDDLPLATRVALHTRVGEALETCYGTATDQHAGELARHFLAAAADDEGRRGIAYAVRAGNHATRVLAHEQAVAHYRAALAALQTWRPADERGATNILLALGEAQVRAGEPKAAEATFLDVAAAARRLDLPELLGRAALGLGQVERFLDRLGDVLDEALANVGPADSALRARLLSRRAVALYWSQPEDRKRTLSDEAVAMARRLDDTPTLAYVLSSRIASLSGPDDVEQRLATAVEMTELGDRCGDRELAMVGRGWSLADRLALAEIDRVRQDIEAFTRLAHELRHPYFLWWAAALGTMHAILSGRLADAERTAHEALALGQRAVTADATQVFAGHLYALRIEQQRLGELEPIIRSIVEQFPDVAGTRGALALLCAEEGRPEHAARELALLAERDFADLPRNPEWLSSIAILAQTSALLPNAPHAARLYELLRPYGTRIIVSGLGALCSGAVAHFLGLLASRLERWQDAEAHLDEALRLHTTIGAPGWAAYTLYESAALALRRADKGDRARAEICRQQAGRTADVLGMPRLQAKLAALDGNAPATSVSVPAAALGAAARTGVLRKVGDYWTVAFAGPAFHLKDSIGLRYIAMLVQHPEREFLAADLVATLRLDRAPDDAPRASAVDLGDAGPLLDARAKAAYRTRLKALQNEIEEARRFNDGERAARLRAEREALTEQLAQAVGLGGRDRKPAAAVERARVSATRAIQAAVRRIRANDPALGSHLANAIRTGTFCCYTPDPSADISWQL